MPLNNLGLGFTFTATNLASGTINRLRGQLRGLGAEGAASGRMMNAGMAIAAAGVVPLAAGLGGLATGLGLANAAAEFEQGVQRVANISGATAEELRALSDAAIQAGIDTSFSPEEALQGLTALASLGFTAAESMEHLNQALALAEGGQIGVEDASRATAAAIRVFSLSGEEAATVADRLLMVTNTTALEAGDLSLALGTVARGAGAADQNLNEMLISMGLVRNTGVEASVAASSVSSALQHMAQEADAFRDIGVNVTDSEGNFRDFIDIVMETNDALGSRYTDAAERAAAASDLFGRFGLTAFQAVSEQITTGVRTAEGELVRGAAAVDYLRGRLEGAEGTAVEFRDRLLDTFAGQATLLRGTMQTLAVVLGLPFARVFAPLVNILTTSLNLLIQVFRSLPETFQTAAAGIFVAVSAFLALGGALTIVAGLLVVIAPFLLAILKVLAVMALILAPVILATLAFGAAIALVTAAVRNNWGGLGDFWNETVTRMRLGWTALVEAVTRGGFTEATSEALQSEPGLRRMVVGIAMLVFRLRQFWTGFSEGIQAGWARIQPAVTRLGAAIRRLGAAFGFLGGESEKAGGALPSRDFAEFGVHIAEMVIDAIERMVNGITWLADTGTAMVTTLQEAFGFFAPIFRMVGLHLRTLWESFRTLFITLGVMSDRGEGDAQSFGEVLAYVFAGMVAGIALVIDYFVFLVQGAVSAAQAIVFAWNAVGDFFFHLGVQIALVFMRIRDSIANTIDNAIADLAGLLQHIPPSLRPEGVDSIVAEGPAALARVRERNAEATAREARGRELLATDTNATVTADIAGRREVEDRRTADIVAAVERARIADQATREGRVSQVNVVVDGEVVARAVANADRREGARGFVPVPAGAD